MPEERRQNRIDISQSLSNLEVRFGYMQQDIADIKNSIKDDKTGYVSRVEFEPIKKIVYGMVGLILMSVMGALVALVIRTR